MQTNRTDIRNRFKEWNIAERLLLEFTRAALTLLLIVSIISLYQNDSRQPKFVVALKTRIEEVELRKAIRETWTSQLRCPVVFAVGKSPHSANNSNIINESSIYGDILQADFIDSYFNLTLKSLSILQWMVEHSAQVDFFVQGDSDMLVSPKRLEHLMSARRYREKKIYGLLFTRPFVQHVRKYAINPGSYPHRIYPPFCSGRFFLMTNDVPEALLRAHRQRVSSLKHSGYINTDDAYFTGIIAHAAGVERTHLPGVIFLPKRRTFVNESEVCTAVAFGELKTPELMRQAWNRFRQAYITCTNA
ncbi:Galactosyl T domain containing protein [Trichuris trichiura]|uniref:Hexosyltransferase n=1 Tax=Trichuris trichiura TaxID=36087 RepID=A0A077Z903_TRITR|nr:Galactosyl T domain containing protein [Trichuris trichiura]